MKTQGVVLFLLFGRLVFSQTLNHYYGNLHAHTGFSDGNKDSLSSGVTNPSGSYAYAKLSQNFDFLGISEHNHYSSANNPGFKLPRFQEGLNMAQSENQDHQFVCLFGMEWGVSSTFNGHVLIYGFNQLIGWEVGIPGVGSNYSVFNAKSDYDGLFRKVKNQPGAFCYLAHPYATDFSTGSSAATALANAPYNAAYDSAIVGMPLRSGLAFSTSQNYDDYSSGNYLDYYKRLLYIGYHLGIGYDHDNHYTNFGRSNAGRMVVMAPSLTRANLMNAFYEMRFYASDDPNAELNFSLNQNPMGSILAGNVYPSIEVVHLDRDGEQADSIKIWRGFKNDPSGIPAQIVHQAKSTDVTQFTDFSVQSGIEYYYFSEIKQTDGQWLVGSPIWYTPQAPVGGLKKFNEETNVLYQPDAQRVYVYSTSSLPFDIEVCSAEGRCLHKQESCKNNYTWDISGLNSGIYWLRLNQSGQIRTWPLYHRQR